MQGIFARTTTLVILALSLIGCGNFTSEFSRHSTQIFLKDSNVLVGELLGINRDSLAFRPQHGQLSAAHWSAIEKVVLVNGGSHPVGRLAATSVFAFGGFILGGLAGSSFGRSQHTGEWAGLAEGLVGAGIGLSIGGGVGAWLSTRSDQDREVPISSSADLNKLEKYCKYPTNYELRLARGY